MSGFWLPAVLLCSLAAPARASGRETRRDLAAPKADGAAGVPLRGRALIASEVVEGKLWGLGYEEAARRLGASAPASPRPPAFPAPELAAAFSGLWEVSIRAVEASRDLGRVELSTGCWLLLRGNRVYGYLQKVPIDDWDSYEDPATRRFGGPQRLHFAVETSSRTTGAPLWHVYRWRGRESMVHLLKFAPRWEVARGRDPRTGVEYRIRAMQRIGDPAVPLYVAVLGRDEIRSLRRSLLPPGAKDARRH